jgi:GTPase SAR1 family protein
MTTNRTDPKAILLCFDLLNVDSFQELPFWYSEVKRNAPDATVYLVGTKSDEPDAMVVKVQDILKIVSNRSVPIPYR